jgi:hypothetical protein
VTYQVSVVPNVPANTAPTITVSACNGGSQDVTYCVIPASEQTTWFGWQTSSGVQNYVSGFFAKLSPTTTDFTGRVITEAQVPGSGHDTCYVAGSDLPNFNVRTLVTPPTNGTCQPTNSGAIDGSCWTVGQQQGLGADTYGLDNVGLLYDAPTEDQAAGSSFPCSIVATQRMFIDCPWNPASYKVNLLEIDTQSPQQIFPVIVTRDGTQSQGSPPPPP